MTNARGDKLKAPESKLFSGQVWVGKEAVDLGLVDGISTIHKFIANEFGVDKVTVENITQKSGPLSSLFGVDYHTEDVFESPFVTTAFSHHVATAFLKQRSPLYDIRT